MEVQFEFVCKAFNWLDGHESKKDTRDSSLAYRRKHAARSEPKHGAEVVSVRPNESGTKGKSWFQLGQLDSRRSKAQSRSWDDDERLLGPAMGKARCAKTGTPTIESGSSGTPLPGRMDL